MKKRVLLFAVSLCIIMLAGGCSTKKDLFTDSNTNTSQNNTNTTAAPTAAATATPTPVAKPDYVVDDYIKLGQYKGVEVDKVTVAQVTDSDITNKINSDLSSHNTTEEITDRTDVQKGDTVNIDYQGLKDGVAFDGGTATGTDLIIGSGQFIPGFEDQLIGAKVGEKVQITVTFPTDYPQSPDLAGQPVVFNVTVNSIKKTVTPELNDDFVKNNTSYSTVDEYKAGIRSDLQAQYEKDAKDEKQNNVLNAIVANSQITYPQGLLDYYKAQIKDYYTSMASYYGMDFASFLSASGKTEDQFNTDAQTYAETMSSQELVIKAVIEAEKMELTDQEYQDGVAKLATDYGYSSSDEFLKTAAESDVRETLLWQKALDFVTEQSVEK